MAWHCDGDRLRMQSTEQHGDFWFLVGGSCMQLRIELQMLYFYQYMSYRLETVLGLFKARHALSNIGV